MRHFRELKVRLNNGVLQGVLPLWDDENRGIPNPFVRSGLFTVGNSEKREYVVDMVIASLSNYEIKFTGRRASPRGP